MNIKNDERDLIQNYWTDISQDPEWISKDTGLDYGKVMEILRLLQKNGDIKDFDESEFRKILKFNEVVSNFNSTKRN